MGAALRNLTEGEKIRLSEIIDKMKEEKKLKMEQQKEFERQQAAKFERERIQREEEAEKERVIREKERAAKERIANNCLIGKLDPATVKDETKKDVKETNPLFPKPQPASTGHFSMDAIVQSSDKNLLNKVVFGKNYSSKNGPKLPPDGPQSNPSQRPYPYPVYERYDGYTVPHPNNMPPPHHHHHPHPHHPYGTNHYANPYGTYPESDMGPYGSHNPYDQGPYSAMHDPYNPHHNPNNMYENYSGYPYGGVTYPGQPNRDPGYPTHGIHGGRPIYPPYGSAIHGKTTSPVSTTATRTSNDKNRSGTPVNQINQDNRYISSSPQVNNIYLKNSNALATDNKQFHEDSQNTMNEFGPPHH